MQQAVQGLFRVTLKCKPKTKATHLRRYNTFACLTRHLLILFSFQLGTALYASERKYLHQAAGATECAKDILFYCYMTNRAGFESSLFHSSSRTSIFYKVTMSSWNKKST